MNKRNQLNQLNQLNQQNQQNLSFYGFRTLQGRNPQGAPRIPSRFPFLTNLNHFYPVAERNGKPLPKSRWTGFGSEQPEFVARNTATLKICTTKIKGQKSP